MVCMPAQRGFYVTSGFGPRWGTFHWGTDFGNGGGSGGKPVFAMKAGRVSRAGLASGFGRWVTIDHPASNGGGETVYGHVIPEVSVGQWVEEGQRIARIDPNSATNGGVAPHLHAEWHERVWVPPGPGRLDPMVMLRGARWPGEAAPSAGATKVAARDMFDLDWSAKFWENGSYKLKRLIVLHTTENGANATAEDVARFQLNPKQNTWGGAYTGLVDSRGVALRANTDDQKVPAAGNASNTFGVHISLVAFSSWTREQWLAQEKMLNRAARLVFDECAKHGIPIRRLTPAEVASEKWGITDHNGTRLAFGGTTHTDVGAGFPWDVFLRKVESHAKRDTEEVMSQIVELGGVSAAAVHDGKTAAQEARDLLSEPVPSMVNPEKSFTPVTLLRLIDASTWEQRRLTIAIARKLGLDPGRIIDEAIAEDRAEVVANG